MGNSGRLLIFNFLVAFLRTPLTTPLNLFNSEFLAISTVVEIHAESGILSIFNI